MGQQDNRQEERNLANVTNKPARDTGHQTREKGKRMKKWKREQLKQEELNKSGVRCMTKSRTGACISHSSYEGKGIGTYLYKLKSMTEG